MRCIHKEIQELFDGFEEDIHDNYPYRIQRKDSNTKITILDILKNDFEDLVEVLNEAQFQQIIEDIQPNKYYRSKKSGLHLYYLMDQQQLFIFSYGEKQPARYQLFLEAIYDLKE